jgi:hypothetical protein
MTKASADKRKQECPNRENHTEQPKGYVDFAHWASEMNKTHRQDLCPGCLLYVIWTPREDES